MFENLNDKLERAFKVLKGQGQITEINVSATRPRLQRGRSRRLSVTAVLLR